MHACSARALVEKSCSYSLAVDRHSYLSAFIETVRRERLFREHADDMRREIEEELHQNLMADASLTYSSAAAASAVMQQTGGQDIHEDDQAADRLRFKETVDRMMNVRMEMILSCKLAALLGQPYIFLNREINTLEVLEMVATALGVGSTPTTAAEAEVEGPLFGGLEVFMLAANPISQSRVQGFGFRV